MAIEERDASRVAAGLDAADCLRELHVVDSGGEVYRGWDGVARIAAELPATGWVGELHRRPRSRALAEQAYHAVARNRHELSLCRGGACSSANLDEVRRRAAPTPFWTCYSLGMVLRLPLVLEAAARAQAGYVRDHFRTFRRRATLIEGAAELWFLGGPRADLIPLLFGERFCALWYRGALIDPGTPLMRRSLRRHLDARRGALPISVVAATHMHEEHVGNLEWAADRLGVPLLLAPETERRLRPAARIPLVRAAVIGQPPSLRGPVEALGARLPVAGGELEVMPAPGHSPDHIVFWDAEERVLLAGDSFMGAYFSSPNPDVDSRAWMGTLERMLDLDVETMIEGHGHVHTMRSDIPLVAGVVERVDPKRAIAEKLEFLSWLADRIDLAARDGLGPNAVVASCFPWGRRWSWERMIGDEAMRVATAGEFSRHELIRSFHRDPDDVLPTALEAKVARG